MAVGDDWKAALATAGDAAAHLEARAAAGARPENAGDLVLAFAAARGDAAALRRLETVLAHEAGAAARRVDPSPAFADEVRQVVRVRLLVAEGGEPPRILGYAGRGPLAAWIGVAALRAALNLKRGPAHVTASDDVLAEVVSREPDPELRQLKTTYRAAYRTALEEALAALPERQRALLRLSYVEGLRLAQIARLWQVHESTASRWIAAATEAVAGDTRRRLVARLAVSPATADSVGRMVLSGLDLSIARLLGKR